MDSGICFQRTAQRWETGRSEDSIVRVSLPSLDDRLRTALRQHLSELAGALMSDDRREFIVFVHDLTEEVLDGAASAEDSMSTVCGFPVELHLYAHQGHEFSAARTGMSKLI
jgi:hypothetical protein